MSKRKIRDIGAKDLDHFQWYNMEGRLVDLTSITNVTELQILLAREWQLRELLDQKLKEFREILVKFDTNEYLDMEFDE